MDCRELKLHIDDLLDQTIDGVTLRKLELHLFDCQDCRAAVAEEKALRQALADMPVPPPSPGFHDRVLKQAARSNRAPLSNSLIGMSLAATLALGIGIGVLYAPQGQPPDSGGTLVSRNPVNHVALVPAVAREIHLAFKSERELQGVTLVLRLPDEVELVGYPGMREISWRTDLDAGVNRLTLPLLASGNAGGELIAELDHGELRKRFSVMIDVRPQQDSAVDASMTPV